MTDPVFSGAPAPAGLPELRPAPSFAPKRGPRKATEPNPWDSVVAGLAVGENGFSAENTEFDVATVDDAKRERKLIRKAARDASLAVKVQIKANDAGSVTVNFGIVPKTPRKASATPAGGPEGAVVAPADGAVPVEAPGQVDF